MKPDISPEQARLRLSLEADRTYFNIDNDEMYGMIDAYNTIKGEIGTIPTSCGTFTVKDSTNQEIPIIGNNTNTKVNIGDKIAVPIDPNWQTFDIKIGGKTTTLLEVVQNYAITKVPPDVADVPEIYKSILITYGSQGQTHLLTYTDALEVLACSVGLCTKNFTIEANKPSPAIIKAVGTPFSTISTVTVSGEEIPPSAYVWDKSSLSLKVLKNLNSGDTVTITGNVDPNGKNIGFPNLINNNPLNYGIYYDFEEASGNTVYDKSGNNNHGDFYSFDGVSIPERITDPDNLKAIKFSDNTSIKVPDSNTYEIPFGGTVLFTLRRENNTSYQTITIKHHDYHYGPQGEGEFVFQISPSGEIVATYSTPTSVNGQDVITFVSEAKNLPVGNKFGVGVSYDVVNKKMIIVANQSELSWSIYSPIPRYYSSINDVNSLYSVPDPLHIGNFVFYNEQYIINQPLKDPLHDFAIIPNQYLTANEMKAIFYSMGIT